jgi:hypothetical protein
VPKGDIFYRRDEKFYLYTDDTFAIREEAVDACLVSG